MQGKDMPGRETDDSAGFLNSEEPASFGFGGMPSGHSIRRKRVKSSDPESGGDVENRKMSVPVQ